MKQKPPIIPKYIQVMPKEPSGMKKAPMTPPITKRYFIPQNLWKKNTNLASNKSSEKDKGQR